MWGLLVLACTQDPAPRPRPEPEPPSQPTDSTSTPDPTAVTGTTGATGDTGPELDCSILPAIPVTWQETNTFQTAEDFDIDGDGYLCTISSGNLACRDMYGDFKILAPNVASSTAGTRVLATGDWVVADVGGGGLKRVDVATGASTTVVSGLAYPNGVEVGRDGWVFVAENSGQKVRQIDPYTGEQHLVAGGLNNPNGVILSPDEQTLYVGSFGGGMVYAIDRLGDTEWDEERILWESPGGDGGFDGINVDACGNVYITEFVAGRIIRVSDVPGESGVVADVPAGWIPNMRWGHGIGGWETDTLYVTYFSGIYGLQMGIEGKKHVLLP
jgi:hypothetical protein